MAQCPLCLTDYDDDDEDQDGTLYECIDCGAEGFDCCVAGDNAICKECREDYLDDDDEEDDDGY